MGTNGTPYIGDINVNTGKFHVQMCPWPFRNVDL